MKAFINTFTKPDAQGNVYYEPLVDFLRSGEYGLNPPANLINLAALGRSQLLPLTARQDGYLILTKMMGQRTGNAMVMIFDSARSKYWMNNEVHFDTIVGDAEEPGMFAESKVIEPTQSIQVGFRDISGAPNAIYFNFGGAKLYHQNAPKDEVDKFLGKRRVMTYPYFMTPDIGAFTIPAGGLSQQVVTIPDEFDFEILKINSVFDELFTYEIKHRGDTLTNNAQVHCNNGTGTARRPYILPQPLMVRHGEILELNFTNLSPINPNVVYFTLIGRAIELHS